MPQTVIKRTIHSTKLPISLLSSMVCTLNAKKMGRHRRGTLFLKMYRWIKGYRSNQPLFVLEIEWTRPTHKVFYFRDEHGNMRKVPVVSYTNHSKLLKVLHKYNA